MATVRNAVKTIVRRMSGITSECSITVDKKFRQKTVKVSVLGADTSTGEPLTMLLKQNPIVSQIYLYGSTDVIGIAADLKHIDTRTEVTGYYGSSGLNPALRRADIVIFVGESKCPGGVSDETRLRQEAEKLIDYAKACTKYAPKALLAVCVRPVSASLPLVSEIFKMTHWYHPGRIIGSASLSQIRVNSYIARQQDLDPRCVHVPLVGGPDLENVVAMFSISEPISIFPPYTKELQKHVKLLDNISTEIKEPIRLQECPLSEAYSINQLVTTMALGLCGDSAAVCHAFVRQNILKNCRYLVSNVKFGQYGVFQNFGIPLMARREMLHFEQAIFSLCRSEQMAIKVLKILDKDYENYAEETERLKRKSVCC